jgi:hypothetical protein
VHPHDNFDRDLVHTLIARPPDGREVVIGTGKGAIVVGLDPESGGRLWDTPVGLHRNDDLETLPGPTEVAPRRSSPTRPRTSRPRWASRTARW